MANLSIKRNVAFSLLMCLLFATTAFAFGSSVLTAGAADTGMVPVSIINVTPNELTIDASDRTGSDLQGKQPAWATGVKWSDITLGASKNPAKIITDNMSLLDRINLKFPSIKEGYVPVAMWAEYADVNSLSTAKGDFRQWMWTHIQNITTRSGGNQFYVEGYIKPVDYMASFDSDEYTGVMFSPRGHGNDTPRKSGGSSDPLYLVVGAIPMESDAVSYTVQTVGSMNIGNDYHYQSPWTVDVKITNNASYPISGYVSWRDLVLEPLLSHIGGIYDMETAIGYGGEYYMLMPTQSTTVTLKFQSGLHTASVLGTPVSYLANYATDVNALARVKILIENFTHGVCRGENAAIVALTELEQVFPGDPDAHSSINIMNSLNKGTSRSKPTSMKPAMMGTNDIADSNGKIEITIKGVRMDKIARVAMVVKAGTGGKLEKFFDNTTASGGSKYKKKMFVFAENNTRDYSTGGIPAIEPVDAATRSAVSGSPYLIPFKRTSTSLVLTIWEAHLPKELRSIIYNDTYSGNPNPIPSYLDFYLFHENESGAVIGYNNIVDAGAKTRAPDLSLPISAKGNSGSVSTEGSGVVGGSYLAVVPSNIVNQKPVGSTLTVTNMATSPQMYYSALRLVGGTISKLNATTWSMSTPCRINDYMTVKSAPGRTGVVKVKAVNGLITLWSEDCELYAGITKVMANFYSEFDSKSDYYASNYLMDQLYANNNINMGSKSFQKIMLTPRTEQDAMRADFFVISGGVTHVYPYKNEAGIGIKARVFDLIPELVTDFGIDKYLALGLDVDEFRVPYTDYSTMPAIALANPVEMDVGGDFYFFKASASLMLDINTLPENEHAYISVSGSVNLFEKLQCEAELLFVMYNGEFMPDIIYFAAGSDVIGLVPPVPIIELSKIGGGIYDLGKTFGGKGEYWNKIPPVNLRLNVSGELNLYAIGLGFEDASVYLGPSLFRLELGALQVKKLTLFQDLVMGVSWDLSAPIEIANGIQLSMPIINFVASGTFNPSIENTPIHDIINATSTVNITVRGDHLVKCILADLQGSDKNAFVNALRNWDGSDSMAFNQIISEALTLLKKQAADYLGVIELNAIATGEVAIPSSIPVVGGYSIASGSASIFMKDSLIIANIKGKTSVLGIDASFTFYFDAKTGKYAFDKVPEGYVASAQTRTSVQGMSFVPMVIKQEQDQSFVVETGDDIIALELFAASPTAVQLTSTAGTVDISSAPASGQTNGWIQTEDGFKYTHIFRDGQQGLAGTEWTIDGQITSFKVTRYDQPVIEGIQDLFFDDTTLGGSFQLVNAEDGWGYFAEIRLTQTNDLLASDLPVSTTGVTDFVLSADILKRFSSGNYSLTVIVTKASDSMTSLACAQQSAEFAFVNDDQPEAPAAVSADYVGNGRNELSIVCDQADGFVVTVRTDSGDQIAVGQTYPYEQMVFGTTVSLAVSGALTAGQYQVTVAPYVLVDSFYKLVGDSDTFVIMLKEATPAVVSVDPSSLVPDSFVSTDGFNFVSRELVSYDDVSEQLVADEICISLQADQFESCKVTFDVGDGVQQLDFDSAAELALHEFVIQMVQGQYYIEVSTVSQNQLDTFFARFAFVVDGTAPTLVIASDRVIFDGTNFSVAGYVEPGSQVVTIGNIDVTGLVDYKTNTMGQLTGEFGFDGVIDVEGVPYGEDARSVVFSIEIVAKDQAGNTTTVVLLYISDAEEETQLDNAVLTLASSAGELLAVGMNNVTIQATLVMTAFLTEMRIDDGVLFSSSHQNVVEIDNDGNLTIKSAGSVTITAEFQGYSAFIVINVLDRLALDVLVAEVQETSVSFNLGAMPLFEGQISVLVSYDGTTFVEQLVISEGFDHPQLLTVSDLKKASGIDFRFVSSEMYAESAVYVVTSGVDDSDDDDDDDDDKDGAGAGSDNDSCASVGCGTVDTQGMSMMLFGGGMLLVLAKRGKKSKRTAF